jgi:NitT/TauT family transport system substrate-binding protein
VKPYLTRNSAPLGRVGVLLFLALLLDHRFATGTAAQTRTNLAGSVTSETMTVLWVARDRGLFKKHGLDMQFILMPRNPLAIAALLAGEIDAAIVGPGHVINAASSGVDVIGIANLKQKLDYRLAARPEIKSKEDLRGKRIAVSGPGSTSHLQALLALQDLNLDVVGSKVAFITIPGTEINRRLALETGGIDVTALTGSVGDLYGNKGYTVLYNSKNTGATLPQTMLVTTRRLAAAKPHVIDAYLKTFVEAVAVTLDPANKELVMRLQMTNLRLASSADAEEAYHSVINSYERAPHTSVEGMKRLQKLMAQITPKIADVRVESVVDNSFMNKVESSGYIQSLYKKN